MKRIPKLISWWMIGAIAVVSVAGGIFYTHYATKLLVEHESRANRDITYAVQRAIWPRYRAFVTESRGLVREQLLARPEITALDNVVRQHMQYTNILKAKLYNLDGLTIYSSQADQIGTNKSDNAGFQDASKGITRSYLAYRSEFHAFENIIADRDIISSYVPLRESANGKPVGVIEVYSDVTELVDNIYKTRRDIMLFGFAGFTILFIVVQFVALRVERVVNLYEEKQWQIAKLAYTDELTGLPNRNEFKNNLQRILEDQRVSAAGFGLAYIDLDGFKQINDQHGHAVGDEVLRHVGTRLQHTLRTSDIVYRIGGDEFTVILLGLRDDTNAGLVAEKLIREIVKPIGCAAAECVVTASIGIALRNPSLDAPDKMIHAADQAMYEAKNAGANQYRVV